MITVVLNRNESVRIQFMENDGGEFQVTYGKKKITVSETNHSPDDKGRTGTLYELDYAKNNAATAASGETDAVVAPTINPPSPPPVEDVGTDAADQTS